MLHLAEDPDLPARFAARVVDGKQAIRSERERRLLTRSSQYGPSSSVLGALWQEYSLATIRRSKSSAVAARYRLHSASERQGPLPGNREPHDPTQAVPLLG